MKKILYILCFILTGSSAFLVSCDKPEELTPKVDNTSEDYLLPTGNIVKKYKHYGMNTTMPLTNKKGLK